MLVIEADLPLFEHVASHIEGRAEDIVDSWLVELQRRLRVRDIRLLPTEELRDHLPVVVRSIAAALRLPRSNPTDEVIPEIRLVTELRREQSYPVVEVLREFQILSEIIGRDVVALLESEGDQWSGPPVARLVAKLSRATSAIGVVAVETYQEAFMSEKQRLAERLSELAGTLEHEIRAPLQAAANSVEILSFESVAADPSRRDLYTGIIRDRLQRISQLITDVRELSVAERTLTREQRKPVREVIREVIGEVESAAEDKQVEIEVVEPIAEIRVDPARVEVALMNLVNNAIKYSDPDKPRRWVKLSLHTVGPPDSPRWQLRVQDNGLGIAPSLQQQVFQRRVRLHPDRAHGTGLGLSIVKETMEQRGGAVHVESEEGEGSTFVLEMTPRLAEPEISPDG